MVKQQLYISPEKIYQKIKYYCAYQERSHYEVKEKLYSFGLRKNNVEELISKLIEDDLLNEERFAKIFARGKFSLKKWGRIKIEYELKQKRVSTYNIRKGMEEIDSEKYKETLQKLATAKWKSLKNEQYINRQAKTMRFLLQKGFENALVQEAVKAQLVVGR
jgi:regulatory protein